MAFLNQLKQKLIGLIHSTGRTVVDWLPWDLEVDLSVLKTKGRPGTVFAWALGPSATELVAVGMHPALNNLILTVGHSSRFDRYFRLCVDKAGLLAAQPMTLAEFLHLSMEPVAYRRKGLAQQFTLMRGAISVGEVKIDVVPHERPETPHLVAHVQARDNATQRDLTALELWAERAGVEITGTLFHNLRLEWSTSRVLELAA